MKRITIALAAAAVMALAAAPGAHAAGLGTKAQAQVLGPVVNNGDGTATVTARYTCPEGFHLWVSAKQVADAPGPTRPSRAGQRRHLRRLVAEPPDELHLRRQVGTGEFLIGTFEYGFGELEPGLRLGAVLPHRPERVPQRQRWVAVV